jgi:YARHG domain-containing protein
MKRKWIMILLLSLILVGCKKADSEESNDNINMVETTAEASNTNSTSDKSLKPNDTKQASETKESENSEQVYKTEEADKSESTGSSKDKNDSSNVTIDVVEENSKDINLSYYANFIYTSFDGDVCSIKFDSATKNQITFEISVTKYEPNIPSQVSTAENCIGTLRGDVVEFDFIDNFNNKGSGTLRFDNDDILLKTTIEETNSDANYSLEVESKLFREEVYGDARMDSSFIFSDSNSRYLNEDDLIGLSKEDLGYARNEIFARYGYFFSSPKYSSYFHRKTWYDRHALQIDAGDKPEDYLNDYEIQNIKLIKKYENK